MPYMTDLKPALVRFGLGPYLEEVPGWETRGSASFAPACTIGHHTAGPRTGDRPSLNICVNGRARLPGPLCNDFLSRSKVILVAAGRANHAGAGGFRGLVGNSAAFGNEAESTGVLNKDGSADWSEFQRWAFPRVHAAHLWLLGRDASWYAGHRDWTARKIDPTAIGTVALRGEIAELLADPDVQEDEMTPEQHLLLQQTKNAVDLLVNVASRPVNAIAAVQAEQAAQRELLQQLAERQGTPIDYGRVEATVEKGVADAIKAIETTVRVESTA